MTIGPLAKEDIQEVMEIAKERNLLHSLDKEVLGKSIKEAPYKVFVAKDKTLEGYILIVLEGEEGEIDSIAVRKESEGKGIASSLLSFSLRRLKESGIRRILLEVKQTNRRAYNLYAKFGFRTYRIRKGYYEGIDALCMEYREDH